MRAGYFLMLVVLVTIAPSPPPSVYEPLAVHGFTIDGLSWQYLSVVCDKNELLRGSFEATSDGSLYPGDEQKYDDWVPIRIDFTILSAPEFALLQAGDSSTPLFEMHDVSQGSWSLRIPEAGEWFLVYFNPTIYFVQIDGHTSRTGFSLLVASLIVLLPLGAALALGGLLWSRRGRLIS